MKYKTTNIMRELKDYFCTYQQSKALMSLDCQYRWVVARYENDNDNVLVLLLRSQALDYFRELGYKAIKPMYNVYFKYHWFRFDYNNNKYHTKKLPTYHEAEIVLIDKLIELEKEARNG